MGGAAELHLLAAAILKEGNNPAVAADMGKGLRRGRSRIRAAFKTSVMASLPSSGGLNKWVASSSFRSPVTVGLRVARMKVSVSKAGIGVDDIASIDDGLVLHQLYGRGRWYAQGVPPGTISEPIVEEGGDQLEQAVENAADGVVQRIVGA